MMIDQDGIDIGLLLTDIKDFYIWKQFANDKDFIKKWIKDRDGLLESIPRSSMSK
jgi:hypothetical protein